jgi:hypothetical protein
MLKGFFFFVKHAERYFSRFAFGDPSAPKTLYGHMHACMAYVPDLCKTGGLLSTTPAATLE